jgi:hypothetical protein
MQHCFEGLVEISCTGMFRVQPRKGVYSIDNCRKVYSTSLYILPL